MFGRDDFSNRYKAVSKSTFLSLCTRCLQDMTPIMLHFSVLKSAARIKPNLLVGRRLQRLRTALATDPDHCSSLLDWTAIKDGQIPEATTLP